MNVYHVRRTEWGSVLGHSPGFVRFYHWMHLDLQAHPPLYWHRITTQTTAAERPVVSLGPVCGGHYCSGWQKALSFRRPLTLAYADVQRWQRQALIGAEASSPYRRSEPTVQMNDSKQNIIQKQTDLDINSPIFIFYGSFLEVYMHLI